MHDPRSFFLNFTLQETTRKIRTERKFEISKHGESSQGSEKRKGSLVLKNPVNFSLRVGFSRFILV